MRQVACRGSSTTCIRATRLLPEESSAKLSNEMSRLCRIGVAIDSDLLDRFDSLIAKRGYSNRSEAFRDLIREDLVETAWQIAGQHGGGDRHAGL